MSSETDRLGEERAGKGARAENELAEGATKARPAKAKSGGGNSVPAPPRSRRVPLNAGPKSSRRIPLNQGPKSSRMKVAPPPRSHRMALREGKEPSIPPVASDLDEQGQRVFKVGATPSVVPAPLPARTATRASSRADEEAADRIAASLARPAAPYLRAVTGLVLAVALVLGGRSFVQRSRHSAAPAVAAAAPPPVVDAIPPPPAEEPVTPLPTSASAESEKTASLAFLQAGKVAEAIAAGERATSLDPTDADAWRILGAAYEDQGNFAAARAAFSACTKSATRGDIRECTLLLH